MKILLIGEYSNLHNSLKQGLIKLGHEVVLIGSGDGFKKYNVDIFTIEHNFIDSKRNVIFNLMMENDYLRVFQNISQWDDWYIKKDNRIFKDMTI